MEAPNPRALVKVMPLPLEARSAMPLVLVSVLRAEPIAFAISFV